MKKNLIVLISLMMAMNAFAEVTWDGSTKTAWTEGAGTAASPYIISSPNHLAYLAQQVNAGNSYSGKYFKQTQDFNLNSKTWTSIGTSSNKFAGTYDGGNKYISNMQYPIWGYINNATIKNLKIKGNEVSKSTGPFAPLVLQTYGTCTITNCHSSLSITETSSCELSGLIYQVNGTKLTMTRCSYTGKIADAGLIYKAYATVAISECFCINPSGYSPNYYHPFLYEIYNSNTCTVDRSYYINNGGGKHGVMPSIGYINFTAFYMRMKSENAYPQGCNDGYFIGGSAPTNIPGMNCYTNTSTSGSNGISPRPNDFMKTERFVEELNKYHDYFTMDYEGINDGYPILKWQAGTRYKIMATCDANRGTVDGGGEYPNGYAATLTATPKEGCMFVGWSDGNTDNPRTVTVNGAQTYTAQFTKSSYTIYVNQDGTSNIE